MNVTVGVLTYDRPQGLALVLPRLVEEAAAAAQRQDVEAARVLVVDNSPDGNARLTVEPQAATAPVALDYVNEVEPGISAGRNRALDECADQDVLVFIDDDETPDENWLGLLLDTFVGHTCHAVTGPVRSVFEEEPAQWVHDDGFFARIHRPTGTRVMLAATNNLLLDLDVVRRLGLRFEARMGIIGGGDSDFTWRLSREGGVIVWCDEAEVFETVPASRSTPAWVARRNMRNGASWAYALREGRSTRGGRLCQQLRSTYDGVGRVVAGAVRTLVGRVTGDERAQARGARIVARGAGMIGGAWGFAVHEYARRPRAGSPAQRGRPPRGGWS